MQILKSVLGQSKIMIVIIWCIILIIFTFTSYSLYISYRNELSHRIESIAQEQSIKLSKLISNQIELALTSLLLEDMTVVIDDTNIKFCQDNYCIDYSLNIFKSLILKELSEYIRSKINLNDVIIFDNTNNTKIMYLFNSVVSTKQIPLKIEIIINSNYLQYIKSTIWKIYKIFFFFMMLTIILYYFLYIINKRLIKVLYKEEYYAILDNMKLSHRQKDWEIQYSNKKNLEIHSIFTNSTKFIVYNNEIFDNKIGIGNNSLIEDLPCAIILFDNILNENICLKKFKEDFDIRFNKYITNGIILNIVFQYSSIQFSSKAAFYQIMYSMVLYIIHIINLSHTSFHKKIFINIEHNNKESKIEFIVANFIKNKDELFSHTRSFYNLNPDPFVLDIRIIFSILEKVGFICDVELDKITWQKINTKSIIKDINSNVINIKDIQKNKK